MVLHDQVDWQDPRSSLNLDLNLVHDVFRRLAKKRHQEKNNQEDAQCTEHRNLDHLRFSKSDVLVALEQTDSFLVKRPLLRMLHTSLACVSNEKESATVEGFVRYRVKERTLTHAIVRDRLLKINEKYQASLEYERQVEQFKQQAKSQSLWCVRKWKNVCPRLSQYYGVHNIPSRPKTQKQIDFENRMIATHAIAVVNCAVQLAIDKLIEPYRPKTSNNQRAGRRSKHGKSAHDDNENEESKQQQSTKQIRKTGTSKLILRARAKREQEQLEARRRELRLQLLCPGLLQTQATTQFFASTPSTSEQEVDTSAEMDHKDQSERLLALIEANGDPRLAQRLLTQKIALAGFRRSVEQAQNLGLALDDQWGIVKTWKAVYRSHTLQSLQHLVSK